VGVAHSTFWLWSVVQGPAVHLAHASTLMADPRCVFGGVGAAGMLIVSQEALHITVWTSETEGKGRAPRPA
jgi:hypothetical protein